MINNPLRENVFNSIKSSICPIYDDFIHQNLKFDKKNSNLITISNSDIYIKNYRFPLILTLKRSDKLINSLTCKGYLITA
jgi:hypothetical protein